MESKNELGNDSDLDCHPADIFMRLLLPDIYELLEHEQSKIIKKVFLDRFGIEMPSKEKLDEISNNNKKELRMQKKAALLKMDSANLELLGLGVDDLLDAWELKKTRVKGGKNSSNKCWLNGQKTLAVEMFFLAHKNSITTTEALALAQDELARKYKKAADLRTIKKWLDELHELKKTNIKPAVRGRPKKSAS